MKARTAPGGGGTSTVPLVADDAIAPADWAGRTFRQLTVLPTLLAMAWLLAGLPLLMIGRFTPLLMGVIAGPLAAVLVFLGYRWITGPASGLLAARGAAPARTPWWAIIAVVVIAVAFGLDQLAFHAQQVILVRDPSVYVQFGNWISKHGSLPIPNDAAAFGANTKGLGYGVHGFYAVGQTLVPQFMAGLPMMLAPAFWLGGIGAATAMGALLGACGVLVAGGLVGRLVGPRWAPLGALMLALTLPMQFTSKSVYSEQLAVLLFLGGLSLIVESFSCKSALRGRLAALGGLALGLTILARIDGLSDLLPLIPYCGLLLLTKARQAWPLIAGVIVGSAYGIVDGLVLSRPYLATNKASLIPLTVIAGVVLAGTAAAVWLRWKKGLPRLLTDRLPNLAALAACLATIILVVRPYVMVSRGPSTGSGAEQVADLQRYNNVPVDPTRLYDEISLHWVFWYLGVPAVVLATIGAALLARRCLRGSSPAWVLPLMSFGWIIVTVLWRPGIAPDQPWASRRLVPGVLPGLIILALWALSWLTGWLRSRGIGTALRAAVVVVLAAALTIPAAVTSWGLSLHTGGPVGVRLVADGLGTQRTFANEVAAADKLCARIPADASVVMAGTVASGFEPLLIGMCGIPAARVISPSPLRVAKIVTAIQQAGRRPVLLGPTQGWFTKYGVALYGGSAPRHVLGLSNDRDAQSLLTPPVTATPERFDIWMVQFPK